MIAAMKPALRQDGSLVHGLAGALCVAACVMVGGCGQADRPEETASQGTPNLPSTPAGAIKESPIKTWTEDSVHAALREANPSYNGQALFRLELGQVTVLQLSETGVTNLAPLAGMNLQALDLSRTHVRNLTPLAALPLQELYLEQSPVEDLSPLRQLRLVKLYLSNTPVKDLSPLRDMPLMELNLLGTGVTDLGPLRNMPLEMLWLNETPVADIAPLGACPLVSLTLHRTQVHDLGPLAGTGLERLHIAETPVTDLRPLSGLRLTRLVFSPERITQGLDIARAIPTLREVGVSLETVMPPDQFWSTWDSTRAGAP